MAFDQHTQDLLDEALRKLLSSAGYGNLVPTGTSIGSLLADARVSSVACGAGLTGGTITSTGTVAVDYTQTPTWSGLHTFSNGLTLSSGTLTIPANAAFSASAQSAAGTAALTLTPNVADSSTSKAVVINNTTALNTAGARILSLQSNSTEWSYIDYRGNYHWNSGNQIQGNGNSLNFVATASAGNAMSILSNTGSLTTAGAVMMQLQDSSAAGALMVGLNSGAAGIWAYGENVVCTGTVVAGQVVVWAGSGQVAAAGASANLTTIAGVAVTGGTNTTIKIATRGRCLVKADAGITAGQLVGTSSATAGNVQSGTAPGAGAIVGRAVEATGATTAGFVTAYLTLS